MPASSFYFNPDGSGLEVFLGPTESALMELAFRHKTLTVKKALRLMDRDKRPAYTTVMTVLGRLAEKGLLSRDLDGRTYVYRPKMDRAEFISERVRQVRDCLKRTFPDER